MIIEPTKMKSIDLIKGISRLQNLFTAICVQLSKVKSDNELTDDMLALTPNDWERVMIILKHLEYRRKEWNDLKSDKDVRDWLNQNASMLGLARDILECYETQLNLFKNPTKGHQA